MKKLMLLFAVLTLAGCARHYSVDMADDPYGFFSGVWHGIVFPFSLLANIVSWLASLFGVDLWRNIEIIGRPNTGIFYYIGFFLGISSLAGGNNAR
jgi:hypothetical protein